MKKPHKITIQKEAMGQDNNTDEQRCFIENIKIFLNLKM